MRLVMLLISGLFLVQCSSSDKTTEDETLDNSNVSAIVDGKVNKAAIRQTFLSHREDIRGCYQEAHKKNPEVAGKFILNFQIQEDGSIDGEKINPDQSTIKDSDFADCILSQLKEFQFPKAPEGQPVTVRYPLRFSGKKKMGSSPTSTE